MRRKMQNRLKQIHRHLLVNRNIYSAPHDSKILSAAYASSRQQGNIKRLLVANRGEIAVRIIRAAKELGIDTVAVCENNDGNSFHAKLADSTVRIKSYMSVDEILNAAKSSNSDAVHPGYGFLSENPRLALRAKELGLEFVGPTPDHLSLFGDKTRARQVAQMCGIPILKGSTTPLFSPEEVLLFMDANGLKYPVMLKAPNGGGGRGITKANNSEDIMTAFNLLKASPFYADGLFVEDFIPNAKHIEVQIIGDGTNVVHLYDRDCSMQLSYQKVIEIAPALNISDKLRNQIFESALSIMRYVSYVNAGTVEFLVGNNEYVFLEVNPRLQVEHTITEEITGVDIVQTQLLISNGATLESLQLYPQSQVLCNGISMQARVCMMQSQNANNNTISTLLEPGGKGVRVDSGLGETRRPSILFDPLLSKIICHYPKPHAWAGLHTRMSNALAQLKIEGIDTNIGLLRSILQHPNIVNFDSKSHEVTTTFLERNLDELTPISKLLSSPDNNENVSGANDGNVSEQAPDNVAVITSQCPARISQVLIQEGANVHEGQHILTLTAMKMDTLITSPYEGFVESVLVEEGDIIDVGKHLVWIKEMSLDTARDSEQDYPRKLALEKGQQISERLMHLRRAALEQGGPEGVKRNHEKNRLTIRERIDGTLDNGTFREYGRISGGVDPDDPDKLTPANFVLGRGEVNGRPVVIGGEDFTISGGSPNLAGLRKSVFAETIALQLKIPLVRLHEGGGGAVGGAKTKKSEGKYSPPSGEAVFSRPRFESVAQVMAVVPCASAALGPVAGLPASRLVASHFSVMTRNACVIIAGPAVVERALGYKTSKEELGNCNVHLKNGVIDNLAEDEADAFHQIRRFLSYMPQNIYHVPPVIECQDKVDRCDEELLTVISPVNRREGYDVREILHRIMDRGSVMEVSKDFGLGHVCSYARLNGKPCGVIANDCMYHGGALTEAASRKVKRFMEICQTFSLPIVFFVDEPGFMVGKEAEAAGTIRSGTAAVLTASTLTVPTISIIMRKVYGVAAASHFAPEGHTIMWPTAEMGALPIESGVAVAFKRLLESLPEPEREIKRKELEASFAERLDPFPRGHSFSVHDLILPTETRPYLCDWIDSIWSLVEFHVQSKVSRGPRGFDIRA